MKRFYLIMLVLTLILLSFFAYNKISNREEKANAITLQSRNTVVIDAGHGGRDAGTIGIDGTEEKIINLSISKVLYDYLMVSGINSILIRDTDVEFYPEGTDTNRSDLYNRLEFVNSVPKSILISIHQNHFSNEKEWGTQIWYSANNPKSKELADSILLNIKDLLQQDNERENKESDSSYYILYRASVPSIMIECGFMSNSNENEKLKDINYQNKIAYSILTGICGEV